MEQEHGKLAAAWPLLVDAALALLATAFVLFWSPVLGHGAPLARPDDLVAALLLIGTALALVLRRIRPMLAYGASVTLAATYLLFGNPPGPVFLPPLAALLTVVATDPPRRWVPAALAGVAVLGVAHGWSPTAAIFAAAWLAVAAVFGAGSQLRRHYFAERAQWAERNRAAETRRWAAEERLRIAREVHDGVGHSLAVISLQAGVAEHLLQSHPEDARSAVAAIRQVSRQALAELRVELAMLRGERPAPPPDLRDLPDMVASVRRAGLQVELDVGQLPDSVPDVVSAAAFRIAQEALTNVARHAGAAAHASVRLRAVDGRLEVEVCDDGPGAGGATEGSGLTGMRERTLALGGSFSAGGGASGGFVVRAVLPL
jgi:signal transduction histidine kinase